MNETFEVIIVDKESNDAYDPHGYLVSFRRPELNFKNFTKRAFLNECIRELYALNGYSMPIIPNSAVYNRYHILNILNELVPPVEISCFEAKLFKASRRLFQETKVRPRKVVPNRNIATRMECWYYKHQRSQLGIRRIPRNYLDNARQKVYAEMGHKVKRKHVDDDDEDSDYSDSIEEGEFQVPLQSHRKIRRYYSNMARKQPHHERYMKGNNTEACRQSHRSGKLEEDLMEKQYQELMTTNDKTLEASVRSILYMQALVGILVNSRAEEN